MKYHQIDRELFVANRAKFIQHMTSNTIAVFNSNDIYPISSDATMPFQQHRDIFYLSGVDQEESILVLFPTASNPAHREVLFLRETNETIAIWEGEKLTKAKAFETSGIKTVYWLNQFPTIFKQLMAEAQGIYLNTNEHLRANTEVETREDRFIKQVKIEYPAHQVHKSAPILHKIRSVKEAVELDLIQRACKITEAGVRRLLAFIKPGVWEYEIEAELIHEFVNEQKVVYGMIFSVGRGTFMEFFTNDEHSSLGEVFRHFCISVSDINELSKIFSFHSVPFSIKRGRTDNTLQGWVTDPNGIRLEFHEYDAKSLLNKYAKL